MPYVDGFVIPIPKKKVEEYRRIARKAGRIWLEYGALEYRECIGEDLDNRMSDSFPRRMRTKRGETVAFSWIVYRSRAHRDRVNSRVMSDPRLAAMMDPDDQPFELKRMVFGGFETIVDLTRKGR